MPRPWIWFFRPSKICRSLRTISKLHQVLLRHSTKDERHRGDYKKLSNNVVAIDANGHEIGVIFETAQPCDTPRLMEKLVHWSRKAV